MLNGESYSDQLRRGFMKHMEYKNNGDERECLAPNKASLPPQAPHYRNEEPCRLDNCYSPMPLGGDADRTLLYPPLKTPVLRPYEPHDADAMLMHATTSASHRVPEHTSEVELRKMNEYKYPTRYMQDDLRQRQLQHKQQVRQLQQRITSLCQQDQALGFQMAYHQQEHGQVAEHAIKHVYLSEQQCTETPSQHPVGHEVTQDDCLRHENMQDRPTREEMPSRLSRQDVEDRLAHTEKIQHGPAWAEKMQNRLRREKMQDRPTLEGMPRRLSCQDVEDRLAPTEKIQHGPACAEKMQNRLRRGKMKDRPILEEMPGRLCCQDVEDRLALTKKIQHGPACAEKMQNRLRREKMQDRPTLEEIPGRLLRRDAEDRLAHTEKKQHGPAYAENMQERLACAEKMQNRLRREHMQDRPTLEEMPGRLWCQDVEDRLAPTEKIQHGPTCPEKMQYRLRREHMQDRPTREEIPGRLLRRDAKDRLAHTEKKQHGSAYAENMQERLACAEKMQNRLLGEQMGDCVMRERLELDVQQDQQTYQEILKSLSHEKSRYFLQWESEQNCQQCKTQESLRHAEMQDHFIQRKMADPNPQYHVQHETQTEMADGFPRNSNRLPRKEFQERYTQKQTQEHFSINSQEKHLKQQPMDENFTQQCLQHRLECEEPQDNFAQEHLPKGGTYQEYKTQQQLNEAAVQENTMQDHRQTIIDGLTPKGVIKNRKVVLFEDQVTERKAQKQAGKPTSSEMYSDQRLNEEASCQFPVEVKIAYSRTQSPNFEISIGGSSCSLMASHEKLSICTGVSKGTAHNLRKIVLSKCKLYNVIDSALKNLSDQDEDDNYKSNSQKSSQQNLTTQCSDVFEYGDVSLPSSRIYQYRDPHISHTASNGPTTPQTGVAPGAFLCRYSSAQPNMAQKNSKLANELRAHLEPPPAAHVPHLCENLQEMSKSEFMNYRAAEPLNLSFDDVVQSKVITPIVTKLQQMYLHSLQDQATAILELQTLPQRIQDVYKAAKALGSTHTCKEMQQAKQPK